MCTFWYGYIKPKYGDHVKLCYVDTDSFNMHIETEDLYKDIADDVEKTFDTSNHEVNRTLLSGQNRKLIELMKDGLGGKIMTEFAALRPKTNSYLMNDGWSDKRTKGNNKCVMKRRVKFNDYKDFPLNNEIVLKSKQRLKSKRHDVYTEEINNTSLSSNDDNRLQTFDRFTSYAYATSAGKVFKTELLCKYK